MGYKRVSYKSKEEGKVRRCTECLKKFSPEDDEDTCPKCAKKILNQMIEENFLESTRSIKVEMI